MTDSVETGSADVSDKTLSKIRALLTQAEDSAATAEEAEAFMAKATELMAKYGIERAMLAAENTVADIVADKTVIVPGPYSARKADLLSWTGQALNVKTIRLGSSRRSSIPAGAQKVHLFGMQSDLERLDILYTSLLLQCNTAMLREENSRLSLGIARSKAWRGDFMQGFAARVHTRLKQAEARARKDYDDTHTSGMSTDLVIQDRTALVSKAVADRYPKLSSTSRRTATTSGYYSGTAAGSKADLGGSRISSTSSGRALH